MIEKILKIIERDIESAKEQISSYLDFYIEPPYVENVDDLIDQCMNWEGNDINLSFEVGYLRALEILTTTLQKVQEEE